MGASLVWVFESFFGCYHRHLSRVFTIRKRTYQVCIRCGREFEYSWEFMHSTRPSVASYPAAATRTGTQAHASAI